MRKVALFFVLGLAYAYAVTSLGTTSSVYFDSRQYTDYGRNLLETGTYGLTPGVPDSHREPGYGFALAGLFAFARATHLVPDLASLPEAAHIFWIKVLQAFLLFAASALAAFRGGFPPRTRVPFFLLCLFSPTLIGAVREIYSEALAIPLSLLFLAAASRAFKTSRPAPIAAAALAWAFLVLTKSYFNFASYGFLLAALALAVLRRKPQAILLGCVAFAGIAAQSAWNARNVSELGANASEPRLSIALAGKVARLDTVEWSGNVAPALAASLGTNFCDARYGDAACSRFDYRGCDVIGNEILVSYLKKASSPKEADAAIKHDMIALWFHRPVTQLFGSALELLRMALFESFSDSGTLPGWLQLPARAWHVLGSVALWVLIAAGLPVALRNKEERGIALVCAGILLYHAGTMSQITNVVRYVFPVLPFAYFFAANGFVSLRDEIAARVLHRGGSNT